MDSNSVTSYSSTPVRIRLQYGVLLFLAYVLAILARNSSSFFNFIDDIPMVRGLCMNASTRAAQNYCMGNFAVYRIACCLEPDVRAAIQKSWWIVKFLLWLVLMIIPFVIPLNDFFYGYAWVAAIGGGFYMLIQVIILLEFAYAWSERWMEKEDRRWQYLLLFCTFAMYAAGITGIILMYVWFGRDGCTTNIIFITITLISGFMLTLLTLRLEHASLVPTAVIFAYCTYLLFSALRSGNAFDHQCNRTAQSPNINYLDPTTLMGLIFVGISMVWTAMSSSGSAHAFAVAGKKDDSEEDVDNPSTYTFFHFVMMLAAMYMAMLMSGWRITRDEQVSLLVDNGTGSMWVKIGSQWATIIIYLWTLIAPVICKDRDFS